MMYLTSKETAARAGIAYRTLMRYVADGLLEPAKRLRPDGSPPELDWSGVDVAQAVLIGQLRHQGIRSPEVLRTILDEVRTGASASPQVVGVAMIVRRGGDEKVVFSAEAEIASPEVTQLELAMTT